MDKNKEIQIIFSEEFTAKTAAEIVNISSNLCIYNSNIYTFQQHRWMEIDEYKVRYLISTVLSGLEDDIIDANELPPIGLIKKLADARRVASKTNFVHEVFVELQRILKKVEFDTNSMLLCCENGVFDFELCEFRDGKPEDYCSLSTKQIYKVPTQEETEYLDNILSKTFPNLAMKQQFIDIFSKCLIGKSKYNINHGIFDINEYGNGGVSTMQILMSLTFGEYYNVIHYDTPNKQAISYYKNRRFIALKSDRNIIKIGGIKQWLEYAKCPIWVQPRDNDMVFQDLLNAEIRHGVFGRCNYNIINFESRFILPSEVTRIDWDKFEKQNIHNIYKSDILLRDKLTTISQTMLWKLINNLVILKTDTLLESKPDIFTNTFNYCVTKCGCSRCVHKFVKNNWTKVSLFLIVNDDLIVKDLRLCIVKILVEL